MGTAAKSFVQALAARPDLQDQLAEVGGETAGAAGP